MRGVQDYNDGDDVMEEITSEMRTAICEEMAKVFTEEGMAPSEVRTTPLSALFPVDPLVSIWRVERRGEISLLGPVPAVSWLWVSAWGSLEPPRPGGENAQKTGKNGGKMGEIRPNN